MPPLAPSIVNSQIAHFPAPTGGWNPLDNIAAMAPDAIVFAAEIPRTSLGKFLKTRLREQYAGWKWES